MLKFCGPRNNSESFKGRLGFLLNIVLYLRLLYWCTRSYKVDILNIFLTFLVFVNLDTVWVQYKKKIRPIIWSLKSDTLPHQYINKI